MNKRIIISLIIIVGVIILALAATTTAVLAYSALKARPTISNIANQIVPQLESEEEGILIAGVIPESPAQDAGIVRGDILTEVNGSPVNSIPDLVDILNDKNPGDEVELSIIHGDDQRNLTVTLGDQNGQPYLGIEPCRTAMPDIRIQPLREYFGVLVVEVVPNSPAAEAGLQEGDIIVSLDGENLSSDTNLAETISSMEPGDTITVEIKRDGDDLQEINITLGEHPEDGENAYIGIRYRAMPNLRQFDFQGEERLPFNNPDLDDKEDSPFTPPHFNLPEGIQSGVLVGETVPGSPAEQAGLQPGDIITAINGQVLESPHDMVAVIADLEPGDEISLTVIHAEQSNPEEIEVTLADNPDEPGRAYLGVNIMAMFKFNHHDYKDDLPFLEQLPEDLLDQLPEDFFKQLPDDLFEHIPDLFQEQIPHGSSQGGDL